MDGFEAYQEYMGIRLHFSNPSYDYVLYNGKTSVTEKSYVKRPDRYFFEKLARHHDPRGFLISNLSQNPKIWIKELVNSEGPKAVYSAWSKRQQSISYNFKREIELLRPNLEESLRIRDSRHPLLLRLYLANKISIETMIILTRLLGFEKYWDKRLADDPIWLEARRRMMKYSAFLEVDLDKFKEITKRCYQSDTQDNQVK